MTFEHYLSQGTQAVEKKDYKSAVNSFLQAIKLNPSQSEPYFQLGDAYDRLGNYKKSIEAYLQGVRLKNSTVETKTTFSLSAEEPQTTLEVPTLGPDHIIIDEEMPEAYFHLGIAFGKLGEYHKALEAFQKALFIDPEYAESYFGMGIVYDYLGDDTNKIASYREAIHFNPQHAESHYNLGIAYLDTGYAARALDEYEILKLLHPQLAHKLMVLMQSTKKQ